MAECGDKYRDLLVTSDGRRPSDPCWAFCGALDYDEWRDVATKKIGGEVWRRWDLVLSVEQKLEGMDTPPVDGPYPKRDEVLFLLQEFADDLDTIPHPLKEGFSLAGGATWGNAVQRAIRVAEKGTCLMEKLDDMASYYDREPLPVVGGSSATGPAGTPASPWWVWGIAAIGAAFFFFRSRRAPAGGRFE